MGSLMPFLGNPIAWGYTNRATTMAKLPLYYYSFVAILIQRRVDLGFLLSKGLFVRHILRHYYFLVVTSIIKYFCLLSDKNIWTVVN